MLHDTGRALGAEYTPIDRMLRIAIDITHLPVLEVDTDTTAAGAHVTGRGLNLVRHMGGCRDSRCFCVGSFKNQFIYSTIE